MNDKEKIELFDKLDSATIRLVRDVAARVESGTAGTDETKNHVMNLSLLLDARGFRLLTPDGKILLADDVTYNAPKDATRGWLERLRLVAKELMSRRLWDQAESIFNICHEIAYEFDEPLSQIIESEGAAATKAREEAENSPPIPSPLEEENGETGRDYTGDVVGEKRFGGVDDVPPGSPGDTISTSSEPLPQRGQGFSTMPRSMQLFVQQEGIELSQITGWDYDPVRDEKQLKVVVEGGSASYFDFETGGTFTARTCSEPDCVLAEGHDMPHKNAEALAAEAEKDD